jgi:beta-lactamase regulating signal transducer with metallopeptidase domain
MTPQELASLALRLTVLVACVAIVNLARRRASAASRHWLWMLGFAGMLLLPIAVRITPRLQLLPWTTSDAAQISTPLASATERPGISSTLADDPIAIHAIPPVSAAMPGALTLIWIVGSVFFFGRLMRAHLVARRIVRRSSPLPENEAVDRVQARYSPEVELPFTYGLINPVVLLPETAVTWSADQLRATLIHEAAHAERGDGIALLITQCTLATYWWHPMAWYAATAAGAERERACDDAVIRQGVLPSEYGTYLLAHAGISASWKRRPLATAMFGHSAGLGARMRALLDSTVNRSAAPRPGAAISLGFVALVGLIGAAAPRPAMIVTALLAPENIQTSDACVQADARRARTYSEGRYKFTGAGAIYDKDMVKTIWTGLDCFAWIQYRGSVDAASDERSMLVGADGQLIAHDEGPSGTRHYVVTSSSATMKVNGGTVQIGSAEQAWIAAMAREFLRRTGRRVHARAAAALDNGGTRALIAEAALVPSADVRAQYLSDGFGRIRDDAALIRFIHDGAALLDSSSARARFLESTPAARRSDPGVLAAIYTEAGVIEPDGDVENVLAAAPPPRPVPASLKPLVERLIASFQSEDRRIALSAYYLDVRP